VVSSNERRISRISSRSSPSLSRCSAERNDTAAFSKTQTAKAAPASAASPTSPHSQYPAQDLPRIRCRLDAFPDRRGLS
jgi:hypothetical protein